MNIGEKIESALWNVLPAKYFHPQEGDKTLGGSDLTKLSRSPSIGSPEEIAYAVFSDTRFRMCHLYEKFSEFLPKEFTIIDGPNAQNCFMYSMGIDPKTTKKFGRNAFDAELVKRKYECIPFQNTLPEKGDIIVYSINGMIDTVRQHAAIYMGDGRVRSRWGYHFPVVEHPLKAVLSTYWNRDENYISIERRI